jgi:dimeric dUTPase (all-alpha-NTP-PPase superfamily)
MLKLFKLSSKINSKKHVIKFFKKYLEFGYFLGYSEKQIKDAYENKHEVNIQRQNTNY